MKRCCTQDMVIRVSDATVDSRLNGIYKLARSRRMGKSMWEGPQPSFMTTIYWTEMGRVGRWELGSSGYQNFSDTVDPPTQNWTWDDDDGTSWDGFGSIVGQHNETMTLTYEDPIVEWRRTRAKLPNTNTTSDAGNNPTTPKMDDRTLMEWEELMDCRQYETSCTQLSPNMYDPSTWSPDGWDVVSSWSPNRSRRWTLMDLAKSDRKRRALKWMLEKIAEKKKEKITVKPDNVKKVRSKSKKTTAKKKVVKKVGRKATRKKKQNKRNI